MNNVIKNRSKKIHLFDFINYAFLILCMVITLYPFLFAMIGSFNEGMDFLKGGVWLYPRKFTLANYLIIVRDSEFWKAFLNTVLRTLVGTTAALLFTSFVAYSMSRKKLKFRRVFQWLNIFTMFFSGGLIPYFLVILIVGLYDTFWVYIIPSLYSVYNMLIISSFFRSIPEDLYESAKLDGSSEWGIWLHIIMPISAPVLATVSLWLAVGHWNSYFTTMVYTNKPNLITLQYYLLRLIKMAKTPSGGGLPSGMLETITSDSVSYAAIVLATIPVICVYPFLQKFFTKGLMLGSLKD